MFSQREIIELCVSIIMLSIAFYFYFPKFSFLATVILVTFSFIIHELGHKFVAMLFGCKSEYYVSYPSLFLAFILGYLTNWKIIIAAPGYVESYKSGITQNERALIALAGPMSNLIMAGICLYLTTQVNFVYFLKILATFNVFMAVFNLVPFSMFDGYEVYHWNRFVWILVLIIGILLFLNLIK